MRTFASILASALLAGALTFASAARADDADQLFQQGNAALEAGKFDDALRSFEAVWKTRKTHDVAANLAQAEIQLAKHRDAAEHLAFALKTFPVSGKASLRKQIEELLATEKTHVVAVRVTVSADKADVRVNGKPAGVAPIADELYADPGKITVEASLDGYETAGKAFEMKAGESRDVELKLAVAVAHQRSMVPAFAIGSVGAASLIAGGALLGVGFGKRSDVLSQEPKDADGKPVCYRFPPSTGPDTNAQCAAFRKSAAEGATLANAGVVLLGVGGAAALGTLAYVLWPSGASAKSGSPQQGARVVPVVSSTGGGFVWTGTF